MLNGKLVPQNVHLHRLHPSTVPRADTQLRSGYCLLQHIRKWEYINAACQTGQESAHNAVLCPVPYIISDMGPAAYVTPPLTAVSKSQPPLHHHHHHHTHIPTSMLTHSLRREADFLLNLMHMFMFRTVSLWRLIEAQRPLENPQFWTLFIVHISH